MPNLQIKTNLKTDWIENRNGFVRIKELEVFYSPDLDIVQITGVGVKNTRLRGLIGVTSSVMDELMHEWNKVRAEIVSNYIWVVQHRTLVDGWVNTWLVSDENNVEWPQVFMSRSDAQTELDEFLEEVNNDPEREEDDKYSEDEFRVVMMPRREVAPEAIALAEYDTKENNNES